MRCPILTAKCQALSSEIEVAICHFGSLGWRLNMKASFSKRHGFSQVDEAEIAVREDAPQALQEYLIQLSYECGLKPSGLREIICQTLKVLPDKQNWSETPNIHEENVQRLEQCKWFKVYDVIERLDDYFCNRNYDGDVHEHFTTELNEFFIEHGIGWKLIDGRIEMRGSESFEQVLNSAKETEHQHGHITASKELHQAIADLSRRPSPDPTGAIQHAMASLECVARQVTGDQQATLGRIMNDCRTLIPAHWIRRLSKLGRTRRSSDGTSRKGANRPSRTLNSLLACAPRSAAT